MSPAHPLPAHLSPALHLRTLLWPLALTLLASCCPVPSGAPLATAFRAEVVGVGGAEGALHLRAEAGQPLVSLRREGLRLLSAQGAPLPLSALSAASAQGARVYVTGTLSGSVVRGATVRFLE